MASETSLILRVRRRVHDAVFDEEASLPHYHDEVYRDALSRALMRVNLALNTSYVIADTPSKAEYLVELRTTIEMCFVRGAEGATGDVTDQPELAYQTMTLPGGFTQSNQQMSYEGARFWAKLAERLEAEYREVLDDVKASLEGAQASIVMGVIQRKSLRTGRAMSYHYDRALEAPDIAVSVSGNNVVISWTPLLTEFLGAYEVERSLNSFETYTRVYQTEDNLVSMYVDTNVPRGHYQYRLRVKNTNDLSSFSPTAQANVNQ